MHPFDRTASLSTANRSTVIACVQGTCIDCHKGIAHELPDMGGIDPGWKVPPELQGEGLSAESLLDQFDSLET